MKTIVITGVTSGIGKSLVRYFLAKGEFVVGIGRSVEKMTRLKEELMASGWNRFDLVKADFSSLNEVATAGDHIRLSYSAGIDVLIHNAAIIPQTLMMTQDHHEMQFQVNYLAAVKLTHTLLPLLAEKHGIIITTNSRIHKLAGFDLNDLEATKHYFLLRSYARSKLYSILFARGINEYVYPTAHVFAYTIDPGLVKTDIMEKYANKFFRWAFNVFTKGGIDPEKIGENYGYLVYDHVIDGTYSFCRRVPKTPSWIARQNTNRDQLWQETERLLQISFAAANQGTT